MNLVVRPELPTASVVRRKRRPPPWTTLHLPTRPESTYKSGKVVQTNGATSNFLLKEIIGQSQFRFAAVNQPGVADPLPKSHPLALEAVHAGGA
jgi:hypothetical protein